MEGRHEVEKLLATRLLLGTLGLAGQTATASLSHVASKAYKDLHFDGLEMHRGVGGKVILGLEAGYQPGSPWEKLRGAFVHQMVENGSEKLGAFIRIPGAARAFRRMSAEQQEAVVKEGLFRAFAQKMGAEKAGRYLARANARLAKMEIHGIPQEVLEEYVAALGHTVFEGEEFDPPSFHDITALITSVVISRSGSLAREGMLGNGANSEAEMPAEVDAATGAVTAPGAGGVPGSLGMQHDGVSGADGVHQGDGMGTGHADQVVDMNFSVGDPSANDPVARRAIELGADWRRFRRGKPSQAKDLGKIFTDYSLKENEVVLSPNPPKNDTVAQSYLVTHKAGGTAVVNITKNGTVWVDTQAMGDVARDPKTGVEIPREEGAQAETIKGGDLVYQAAMTYAYNNGLQFRSDPSGTTAIAKGRRISHMISSALRHGTTRHLSPYGQKKKDHDLVANEWRNEDTPEAFEHNVGLMLRAEMEFVQNAMSKTDVKLQDLRYDRASDNVLQQVKDEHGALAGWRRISERDFKDVVEGLVSRNSGVGPTTLSRALITASEVEGNASGLGSGTHVETAEVLRGREIPARAGVELLRLLGTAEKPRDLYYSRGESAESGRVLRTGVTQQETAAAEARLKSTAQGRAIYGDVLIVDNRSALDGLQGRPGQQRYHAEDWGIMQDAEGFHDPRDGTVVIFRGNVRVLEGETAAQAMARVVVHERVGHHGFDALRESDSKFAEEWKKLAAAISADQMQKLASSYTHLNGNRDALALEWFAHQVGEMGGREQLEPGSVMQQMWQVMRDWVTRQFNPLGDPSKPMTQELIDAHVRGLIRATQRRMVKGAKSAKSGATSTTGGNTLLGGGLQFSTVDSENNKNENTNDANPSPSQGSPQAGSGDSLRRRPADWHRIRPGVDTRRSAEVAAGIFRDVYRGGPQTAAQEPDAYIRAAAPAEIAAVARGRKPVFHDELGDNAGPLAKRLASAFPSLHVEAFDGHLLVVDLEQAAVIAGTDDNASTVRAVREAVRSDEIGEFLGYGVSHWSKADSIVEFRLPSGEILAGFHGRSESLEEFLSERLQDYRDGIGERITFKVTPKPGKVRSSR